MHKKNEQNPPPGQPLWKPLCRLEMPVYVYVNAS